MKRNTLIKNMITVMLLLWGMTVIAASPKRVACVGNSITYGFLVNDREQNCYPVVLQRLLGDDYKVENFGKSRSTLLRKGHVPYWDQAEYAAALEFAPDIVVIHLGVNDTDPRNWPNFNDEFVSDYVDLINSFKKVNPGVRVILANLSPLTSKHFRFKSGTREWRDQVRGQVRDIAEATGSELIDFATPLRDRQNLLPDGIHPDVAGAAVLAETVRGAITGNYGGLSMPQVYSDHMVLQRYRPLEINGRADAGAKVNVKIGKHSADAIADNEGNWTAALPPMPEATGLTMTVSDGKKTLTYNGVAIGEVWVASGQSNMEFPLRSSTGSAPDIEASNDSDLRLFAMYPHWMTTGAPWSETARDSVDNLLYYRDAEWKKASPETVGRFSAVAYYFAKALRDSLKVPVGVIFNAIGGSATESWIDIETLEHGMPEIIQNWRKNDYVQPWVQQRATENTGERRHPYEPAYLFATGIRPLGSYPVAGTIWYQGESNAHNIEIHEALFPMLVDSWRRYFKNPDMPFYFVQLSSLNRPSWPQFRDSQRRLAEKIAGTEMAVSIDAGDSLDVHPRNKRVVGDRLARIALNRTYGNTGMEYSGPRPVKAESRDGAIWLEMDHSAGMHTSDNAPIRTFEVAETEGLYFPATAEIIDNKIKVYNMNVENPRYVRHAWQPFTRANLVNADNLPASTFKLSVMDAPDKEEGIENGVSACFAGSYNGNPVMAGGCNFPVNPMAPDSRKKFYSGIYMLENGKWEKIGSLPCPMAYGASAQTPDGIVLIGGTSPEGALASVWLLNPGSTPMLTELPALPAPADNMYACAIGRKVYVAGGNVSGQPSNDFLCLDLANPSKGWQKLPSFPGNPRVQPVIASGRNDKGDECVWMWGGFAGKGANREATLDLGGYVYNPSSKKWKEIGAPTADEISVGGGAACTLTDGRILVVGGVNKDIFLEALRNQAPDYLSHPIEWYRFNACALVFDPKTRSWSVAKTDPELARAGAAIVALPGNDACVIGGELKPRIRTPHIANLTID